MCLKLLSVYIVCYYLKYENMLEVVKREFRPLFKQLRYVFLKKLSWE